MREGGGRRPHAHLACWVRFLVFVFFSNKGLCSLSCGVTSTALWEGLTLKTTKNLHVFIAAVEAAGQLSGLCLVCLLRFALG